MANIIGRGAIDALIEDLRRQGIDLNNSSASYTLPQLEKAIAEVFGTDVAPLLMRRIKQELEE